MFKLRHKLDLQMFAEEAVQDPGVDVVPAAGEQSQESEVPADQTGVDNETAAESDKQNNFEKAFAKRLAAKETEWQTAKEAELQQLRDQYKDHDAYKKAAEYLQRTSGIDNIMTLKEEIELAELQERAEKENVPPKVLKRIDELEAKAAKADEIEAAQKQEQERQEFETTLKDFCSDKKIDGKPVDHMDLWKYMHENSVSKPEVALKAMKADILEPKLETAKTDAVNEYLQSKQAPKIEGSQGAAAQQAPGRAGSIDAAEERALARLKAAREAQ